LVVLLALKSLGIEKTYVSFVGDLCEIFCWEIYGKDAHEIDVHPLNHINTLNHADVVDFILAEARKMNVNPVSKNFLFNLAKHVKASFIEIKKESGGLITNIKDEVFTRSLLNYSYYKELYMKVRRFIIYNDMKSERCMNHANYIAKNSLIDGNIVYLVRKESIVIDSVKQVLSKFVGIQAFTDKLIDELIDKMKGELFHSYNPFFNEDCEQFLIRTYSSKLYPIRISGECGDIHEEDNKIILYIQSDGVCRIFTYKDYYRILDYNDLKGKILTIEGLPHSDGGLPVCVALKIIERKDPSKMVSLYEDFKSF